MRRGARSIENPLVFMSGLTSRYWPSSYWPREGTQLATPSLVEPTRRDFLYIATGAVAAVGTAAVVWPFISQMNPDASTLALASIEVDVSSIAEGQAITVKWRGKPVFIRHRTADEIEKAKAVPMSELIDTDARNPNIKAAEAATEATDQNRAAVGKEPWLVMIGTCTHLGCVPIGLSGDFGGWFCPCHGSHYDTAGRIRKGPAPENLHIPPFAFTNDTTILIG
jgi:ubiquinol-cytochrome c reductase iron-sulfur subunit